MSDHAPPEAEVERAFEAFERAYTEHFPRGGDAQDHHEATFAAVEAVVALVREAGDDLAERFGNDGEATA
jgi:hypothetical protein